MKNCIRCRKQMDDTPFCPYCGAKQQRKTGVKTRGNGTGMAYKRGKTWTARVIVGYYLDDNGVKRRVERSKSGFKTKSEALSYCPQLMEGTHHVKSTITFSELYHRWHDEYENRIGTSTMNAYASSYKHYSSLHYRHFVDIQPADLQACMDACPAGKRTRETMKTLGSLLYKYALHNEIVSRNKSETLYTGDGEKLSRPPITFDELDRIRASIPDEPYAAYVVCLCYTGFRPGEFLSLTKESYDPRTRCLIGGSKTKAGTDRPVPVSPKIAPLLDEALHRNSKYLFPRLKDGQKMTDNYFRKFCFEPLMDRLGITDRVPYSCRHTFANLLKNVNGSDTDKAAIIGHADASMTKYYQETDLESLRAIVDAL